MKKDIRISLLSLVTLVALFFGSGITYANYSKIPCVVTPNFQSQTANDGRGPSELIIVYLRWSLGFLKHPEHSDRPYYKELQDAVIDARNHYCARTGKEITTVPEIITALAEYMPMINTFSVAPVSITSGQSSTLSWASVRATKCSIEGIGDVSTNGTKVVSPTVATSYTMTCSTPDFISTPKSVTITVNTTVSSGSAANQDNSELSASTKAKLNTWITKNITVRSTTLTPANYSKFVTTIITKLNTIKSNTLASNKGKIDIINYLVVELQKILSSIEDDSFLDSLLN